MPLALPSAFSPREIIDSRRGNDVVNIKPRRARANYPLPSPFFPFFLRPLAPWLFPYFLHFRPALSPPEESSPHWALLFFSFLRSRSFLLLPSVNSFVFSASSISSGRYAHVTAQTPLIALITDE